jgi:hypothetical protein
LYSQQDPELASPDIVPHTLYQAPVGPEGWQVKLDTEESDKG